MTSTFLLVLASASETLALTIAVTGVVAAAVSACIAAWQGFLLKTSEVNRTQPVVIAYETEDPWMIGENPVFGVTLANEGAGTAFNLQFGVILNERRFFYEPEPARGGGEGDVPRALASGQRLPGNGDRYSFQIDRTDLPKDCPLDQRIYWCTYENAFKRVWETQNAWLTPVTLKVKRLRAKNVPQRRQEEALRR